MLQTCWFHHPRRTACFADQLVRCWAKLKSYLPLSMSPCRRSPMCIREQSHAASAASAANHYLYTDCQNKMNQTEIMHDGGLIITENPCSQETLDFCRKRGQHSLLLPPSVHTARKHLLYVMPRLRFQESVLEARFRATWAQHHLLDVLLASLYLLASSGILLVTHINTLQAAASACYEGLDGPGQEGTCWGAESAVYAGMMGAWVSQVEQGAAIASQPVDRLPSHHLINACKHACSSAHQQCLLQSSMQHARSSTQASQLCSRACIGTQC